MDHVVSKHSCTPLSCILCDKVCNDINSLQQHIVSHNGEDRQKGFPYDEMRGQEFAKDTPATNNRSSKTKARPSLQQPRRATYQEPVKKYK